MGVLVLSNWILLRIKLVLAFIIPIMASVYAVIPLIITIYGLIVAALMFFIKIVIACIVLLFRLLILRMTFSKLILNIVLLILIASMLHACGEQVKNINPFHQNAKLLKKEPVIGFFNGVGTTKDEANENVKFLNISMFGTEKSKIAVRTFYNYTDKPINDMLETFEQRMNEHPLYKDHYELFFEIIDGGGSGLTSAIKVAPELAGDFSAMIQQYVAYSVLSIANQAVELGLDRGVTLKPEKNIYKRAVPTEKVYQEHFTKAVDILRTGKRLVFVAHSQGNLFANHLYEFLPLKFQQETMVVHVAPASQVLHGKHVLADQDQVIMFLRHSGRVPQPTVTIPDFKNRPPGLNGSVDEVGHGFIPIYVNPKMDAFGQFKGYLMEALNL